ncbi:MAG: AmmeMemoRadiSam system protein A [Butyrivibrio sp.]|jgi:AmmeMemoRadiSam system protein A/AmmeMemoRadiSam system protein B|nr:AmmeMemoRadiSam system protein A [Butyrivibrio sp.]
MAFTGAVMVPHPPILIPEVGRGEEQKISETTAAYLQVAEMISEMKPETIVLSSPHSIMYSDYFHVSPGIGAHGSLSQFGAGTVCKSVIYDTEFVNLLCRHAQERNFPAGTMGERNPELDHGTMIPLYFIDKKYTDYKLVRIGLSGLSLADHYRLGQMIAQTAKELGRRAVYVASGDLSHKLKENGPYGFDDNGPEYDRRVMEVMGRGTFEDLLDFPETLCEKAAECGHRSFVMMAGALDGTAVEVKKLSHQDTFGVGYGVCTYSVTIPDPERKFLDRWMEKQKKERAEKKAAEDSYVRLARASLEYNIRVGEKMKLPEDLPAEMYEQRAGVFVSLHREGRLRGCIGTIEPVQENVAIEILENAISAATNDPRFEPVREDELESLEYSVDVLGKTEKVSSEDELDVMRYGVIVTKGSRRGLLLPRLDGVDSVSRQILIARQKAGIGEKEDGVSLERFEVVRHF